jgi:hypothetical protein
MARAGAVAQLEERRFCTPEVAGSIPVSSMTCKTYSIKYDQFPRVGGLG